MSAKIPDWVSETPDYEYCLIMSSEEDILTTQNLELTRSEYIALKRHLAAMRGYNTPTVEDALETIRNDGALDGYNSSDDQQVARHIETARDLYVRVPDLVVCRSEEFDTGVRKVAAG